LRLGFPFLCERAVRGFPETADPDCGDRLSVVTAKGTAKRFPEITADLAGNFKTRFRLRAADRAGKRFPETWAPSYGKKQLGKTSFQLTAIEWLSGAAAALKLGISPGNVFVAKHRVQKMLQEEVRLLRNDPE
jgi:hypothetical protein